MDVIETKILDGLICIGECETITQPRMLVIGRSASHTGDRDSDDGRAESIQNSIMEGIGHQNLDISVLRFLVSA